MFGGWEYLTNLDHHYNGRIYLSWRSDYYQVGLVTGSAQSITCIVRDKVSQLEFQLTIVYGFNTKEERRELWSQLESLSAGVTIPWFIMEDFNSVLHTDDRVGGTPVSLSEVVDFQACVDVCELIELPHGGNKYTWNDKHGDSRIFSKIDWAFVNREWLDNMPVVNANFLVEGISDHCPLKIAKEGGNNRSKKPFKYCNVWAKHPQFLDTVKQVWQAPVEGCYMMQVVKKLKQLKQSLKSLHKQHFRNILVEVEEDRASLTQAQRNLHQNPSDITLQNQERQLYQQFRKSSYLAEIFLQQRSKANWIRLGDDNTKYFYSIIKHKRLQQATTQIQDKNGVLQTDGQAITRVFVDYYEELLGRKEQNRIKAFGSFLTMDAHSQ
ncbi:uncharacterized protein LOC132639195 [Lycium barbarum]|uniref:uncharacterized protein LOC132639195 n=1 Tax=Lycium barbarum TaxID=112863 RepID=UPI00293E7698|nr:uncharacterized protein LOC132639195 [Lycium barbarum]